MRFRRVAPVPDSPAQIHEGGVKCYNLSIWIEAPSCRIDIRFIPNVYFRAFVSTAGYHLMRFLPGVSLLLMSSLVIVRAEDEVKWSLQTRLRGEVRENLYDFDSSRDALTDDSWLIHRVRIGFDWAPERWMHFTLQGQDARESFSDRPDVPLVSGAEGDDEFDLRLASIELGDPRKLSLKVGRQVLSYGDERLVGPLEWLNFSRTFDAARFHLENDAGWVEAFTSSVVRIDPDRFNRSDWLNDKGNGEIFSGLYFSSPAISCQTTDLYGFHFHDEDPAGQTNFATFGSRIKGIPAQLGGWDYTVELVGQGGELAGLPMSGYAYHLEGGFNWLRSSWKPRVAIEYSAGSGDQDPQDGRTGTFQNLFPTNHPPYGLMDVFSWQNQQNLVLRLSSQPTESIKATLDLHSFWLNTTRDAWYRANGVTQVRPISPDAANHAGYEADFAVSAKLDEHMDLLVGYSHFFAGDYLSDTGPADDADFGYVMLTVTY